MLKIAKFEFRVTVHYGLWAKCTLLWLIKLMHLLYWDYHVFFCQMLQIYDYVQTLTWQRDHILTALFYLIALKKITCIQKYLDRWSCEKLVHAFISSHLDNHNSLLIYLPYKDLCKVQWIQNSSARLITFSKKQYHITSVLISLHWLPVIHRMNFKVLLLTCKTLSGMIAEHIYHYTSICSCKDTQIQLQQPPPDAIG